MEEYSRLCCLMVEDVYGGFLAQIFKQLSQLGRLSATQVAQRCRLPLRQVKTGLAALIQLRLVYHHTTPDGLSTYQANTRHAYNLLRTGKLVAMVKQKLGPSAANVIEHLAILGYSTVGELEASVAKDEGFNREGESAPFANGHSAGGGLANTNSAGRAIFRNALAALVDDRYIVAVRDAHFQSVFDARHDAQNQFHVPGALSASKGKKTQMENDEKVKRELSLRLDSTISSDSVLFDLHDSYSDVRTATSGQDKLLICVDYSNVILSMRNDRIVSSAEKLFGPHTAQVAQAVCVQIDADLGSLNRPSQDDPAAVIQKIDISSIETFLTSLPSTDDTNDESLENGGRVQSRLMNGHHNPHSNGAYLDLFVDHQLGILAEGPFPFLYQDEPGSWFVNKEKMNEFLRDKEIMRLMQETLDGPALRIVRMLMDKGKLDEKSLQELGLLGAKDLRQCLAQLQLKGFLELQEVPREPQRQPQRTIYLWFYDAERARKVCSGRLYKTMSRYYQRLHLERERLSSTLSKVERTDVQGSEQDMLSTGELQVLFQWRQKEKWFMTEIYRMDEVVALLGDH